MIAARRGLGLAVGAVLVTRCRPAAPPGVDDAIARLRGFAEGDVVDGPARSARAALADVGAPARTWEAIQAAGVAALEVEAGVRAVRLPRLWLTDGFAQAAALAGAVGAAAR